MLETTVRPPAASRRCPACQRTVAHERGTAVKCPHCGRWLALPRNPWLEQLSEMPALASSLEEFPTLPWPELSPSIGFLLAVLLMAAGLHFRVIEMVGFGGLGIVACLIGAAVLEFRADRAAERRGDQGGAMGMLHASSDWPAIGRSRRRRG